MVWRVVLLLQVIAKAKVPIVKFETAAYNHLAFDVSFDVANGPEVRAGRQGTTRRRAPLGASCGERASAGGTPLGATPGARGCCCCACCALRLGRQSWCVCARPCAQAAVLVREFTGKWPMMRPLVLVLKLFLQQRELNEVRACVHARFSRPQPTPFVRRRPPRWAWRPPAGESRHGDATPGALSLARSLFSSPPTLGEALRHRHLTCAQVYTGGIGSYALITMVAAFLQLHTSRKPKASAKGGGGGKGASLLEPGLGVLLVDFFRLYGRVLNTQEVRLGRSLVHIARALSGDELAFWHTGKGRGGAGSGPAERAVQVGVAPA